MFRDCADPHPPGFQPDDKRLLDSALDDGDDFVILVQVIALLILFRDASAMQRDQLPLIVEDRSATAALRCIALVNDDVSEAVVDDLIAPDGDLLLLPVGVLDDGRRIPRSGFSKISVQYQVALLAELVMSADVGWPNCDQGEVEILEAMKKRSGIERMNNRIFERPIDVEFIVEFDRGVVRHSTKPDWVVDRKDMIVGHHDIGGDHEACRESGLK